MMKNAKKTIGLGMMSMVGSYGMGAMVNQMPEGAGKTSATATMGVANSGLLLANVGQLSNTAMGLTGSLGAKKSKSGNKYIDKILG